MRSPFLAFIAITLTAAQSFAQPDTSQDRIRIDVQTIAQLDNTPGMDAFAKGLQASLRNMLERTSRFAPASSNADYAMTGTFQVVGTDVRVNLTLTHVASNRPVAAIRATGSVRDSFAIQNELEHQLIRKLVALHPNPRPPTQEISVQSSGPLRSNLVRPEFLPPVRTLDRSFEVSRRTVQFEYSPVMRWGCFGRFGPHMGSFYPLWWFH
jgi:TolB-like protein